MRVYFTDAVANCLWNIPLVAGKFLDLEMKRKDFVARKFGDYDDGSILERNGIRFVYLN